MDRLRKAMESRTDEIEAGLAEAYKELEEIRTRESELLALIKQGEALIGSVDRRTSPRTLHEAIVIVLTDSGNDWMHVRDVAAEVNRRRLYRKKDGSPVEPNQIHARTKNYVKLFEKNGPLVRLREGDAPIPKPTQSRYDPLRSHLENLDEDLVSISVGDIEELVGELPPSAFTHSAWWANEATGSHVQARSWMNAGWRVDGFDTSEGWVRFRRA